MGGVAGLRAVGTTFFCCPVYVCEEILCKAPGIVRGLYPFSGRDFVTYFPVHAHLLYPQPSIYETLNDLDHEYTFEY